MGIIINKDAGKVSISQDKCVRILELYVLYTVKMYNKEATLLHRCVPSACIFINRLLNKLLESNVNG